MPYILPASEQTRPGIEKPYKAINFTLNIASAGQSSLSQRHRKSTDVSRKAEENMRKTCRKDPNHEETVG
ncbi:Hypothetical protein FKW44_019573 [Caligus rogercresseyi]|uniref:Uncharacterized protein n=1 Tax=Caligus rogercresseyi TaxID=217165 RepID=A0A7T8JY88_CALRO|nr:Hypothetical protein FKW44_019573 [Caligus rogercresseyi]